MEWEQELEQRRSEVKAAIKCVLGNSHSFRGPWRGAFLSNVLAHIVEYSEQDYETRQRLLKAIPTAARILTEALEGGGVNEATWPERDPGVR